MKKVQVREKISDPPTTYKSILEASEALGWKKGCMAVWRSRHPDQLVRIYKGLIIEFVD